MKSRLLLANVALLLLSGTWVIAGGPAEDLRRMAGTWSAIFIETGGKEATPQERGKDKMKLVIKADAGYVLYFGDEPVATGTLRLNPVTKPASVDIIPSDGPHKGKVQPGIYAFQGDDLWIVVAEPGHARPAGTFKTRPGTMESMLFCRRAK